MDRPMPCYIGIDGGGTRTRCMAADETGRPLGSVTVGSANRNHQPRTVVRDQLRAALLGAVGSTSVDWARSVIALGMSGVSTEADEQDIASVVRDIPEFAAVGRIVVQNDTVVGLTGGLSGRPGMVLVAGTGSACLGVNGSGERFTCGGWGAIADDAGSAPWVGTRAIKASVRAEDGRGPATLLRDVVFAFLELERPRDLIDRIHNRGLDREQLGYLAPRVIRAYLDSDDVAHQIVSAAVGELAELVAATVARLFPDGPSELILVGGLATSGEPFQPLLVNAIRTRCPSVIVRDAELSPVHGAVLEAMRAGSVEVSDHSLSLLRGHSS